SLATTSILVGIPAMVAYDAEMFWTQLENEQKMHQQGGQPGQWRLVLMTSYNWEIFSLKDDRQLRLRKVLPTGQSFVWRELKDNEWTSVLYGSFLVTLKQLEGEYNQFYFFCHKVLIEDPDGHIQSLIKIWRQKDNTIADTCVGNRVLRLEPFPTLISFICSSNNNVPRISSMVLNICKKYGNLAGLVESEKFYTFPSIEVLAKCETLEEDLRILGFGYRAKYIHKTVQNLFNDPKFSLESLRSASYEETINKLLSFSGVGPKVAECIALMSLDKTMAVPVDTHIATVWANKNGRKKPASVSPKLHDEMKEYFQSLYGEYAGWAHSMLFTRELTKRKRKAEEIND
ncbi:DNA glycosylase, partial [Rozella allomycis CSF55]